VRKFYAVPSDVLDSLRIQAEATTTPEMKLVHNLNKEMKSVLNDPALSVDEKMARYNNMLQRIMAAHASGNTKIPTWRIVSTPDVVPTSSTTSLPLKTEPKTEPPMPESGSNAAAPTQASSSAPAAPDGPAQPMLMDIAAPTRDYAVHRIVYALPISYRTKGQAIATHLFNTKENIQWDKNGRILNIGDDKNIGGNIVQYIKHSIKKLKLQKPPKLDAFKDFLRKTQVSQRHVHKEFYPEVPPSTLQQINFDPLLTPPNSFVEDIGKGTTSTGQTGGPSKPNNDSTEGDAVSRPRASTPDPLGVPPPPPPFGDDLLNDFPDPMQNENLYDLNDESLLNFTDSVSWIGI